MWRTTLMQQLKRLIIPFFILLAAFGGMRYLTSQKKDQKKRAPQPFIRTVSTQTIVFGNIKPNIKAMGRVMAFERVDLTPEVSGIILSSSFKLRKGLSFKKGAVLIRIDSSQVLFGYNATISDLQNALAALLPELKADLPDALPRWQHFFATLSINSLPPLPVAATEREKLLATRFGVFKIYYEAQQQRNILQKHTIRAPFSGSVESASVYPSSMARAGVTLGTIVRTDDIEIELALSERETSFLTPGMEVRVTTEGSTDTISGTIFQISDILDAQMQMVPVFIRINNARTKGLRDGSYAKITLEGRPLNHAVVIPRKAVHNKTYVYLIADDTLTEQQVTVAYQGIELAYVTAGLTEAETLITEPLQDAVIGMAVQSSATAQKRQQAAKGKKIPDAPNRQSDSTAQQKQGRR